MFNGPVGIAQAQHGQAGQGLFLDNLWIIIVATAATVIAILVAYRLLFPSLTKVKASQENLRLSRVRFEGGESS